MTAQAVSHTHETCRHEFYSMSCDEFEQLIQRANDRCEICSVPSHATKHGKLHIDHDARLGNWAVRGLLCSRCNTLLANGTVFRPEAERYLGNVWRTESSHDRAVFRPDPWTAWKEQLRLLSARPVDRAARNVAIVQATREGMRQRDIVAATGLNREQVRRIVRTAEAGEE
ncbi:endonuclease domain-containing protein [Stackebrandtia soli]|uniref:endonuclease domain-containing protein n=1 Tax=Stackebrandtia soli TaxID=1892856 RepID=UPI0039ECCC4C